MIRIVWQKIDILIAVARMIYEQPLVLVLVFILAWPTTTTPAAEPFPSCNGQSSPVGQQQHMLALPIRHRQLPLPRKLI
ncbi:hypothetical protein ACLKA6_006766 [Drosophila palustris]